MIPCFGGLCEERLPCFILVDISDQLGLSSEHHAEDYFQAAVCVKFITHVCDLHENRGTCKTNFQSKFVGLHVIDKHIFEMMFQSISYDFMAYKNKNKYTKLRICASHVCITQKKGTANFKMCFKVLTIYYPPRL